MHRTEPARRALGVRRRAPGGTQGLHRASLRARVDGWRHPSAYDVFCAGFYNAKSLADGIFWQRLQLVALSPVSVLILWFYALLTGQRLGRAIRVLALEVRA